LARNPFEDVAGRDLLRRRRERSPKASRFWLAGTKAAWFRANWLEPFPEPHLILIDEPGRRFFTHYLLSKGD
jgi:hypothetical protein